jgi:hypothetical protein
MWWWMERQWEGWNDWTYVAPTSLCVVVILRAVHTNIFCMIIIFFCCTNKSTGGSGRRCGEQNGKKQMNLESLCVRESDESDGGQKSKYVKVIYGQADRGFAT